LPLGQSLGVLGVLSIAFLALSFWIFARREYVLDQ
jgi:ABC-type transport system involved in multi-copper enzyme maturation permease subunit